MGTRSLTHIVDSNNGTTYGKTLTTIYRQYDGYLEGHGKELATFLAPFNIVNGFGIDAEFGKTANGMGCLAAQIIAHFKTKVGNFYIVPAGSINHGEEYRYTVFESQQGVRIKVQSGYESDWKLIFSGTPQELLDKVNGN